jgi:hypothetical protein
VSVTPDADAGVAAVIASAFPEKDEAQRREAEARTPRGATLEGFSTLKHAGVRSFLGTIVNKSDVPLLAQAKVTFYDAAKKPIGTLDCDNSGWLTARGSVMPGQSLPCVLASLRGPVEWSSFSASLMEGPTDTVPLALQVSALETKRNEVAYEQKAVPGSPGIIPNDGHIEFDVHGKLALSPKVQAIGEVATVVEAVGPDGTRLYYESNRLESTIQGAFKAKATLPFAMKVYWPRNEKDPRFVLSATAFVAKEK